MSLFTGLVEDIRRANLVLPVLLCYFTGKFPKYATQMKRQPEPATGQDGIAKLVSTLLEANECNPAIHDGAVMLGRDSRFTPYSVRGWSYRLHPPPFGRIEPNRGSAFNSCLDMSNVEGVDWILLVSQSGAFSFANGEWEMLH
jgi:hypothetical protein